MVILSLLGAAYWGFGLMLALAIPNEFPYYGKQPANQVRRRRYAWGLLAATISITLLVNLLEYALNN